MRKTPYEWIKVRVSPECRKILEELAERKKTTYTHLIEAWLKREDKNKGRRG